MRRLVPPFLLLCLGPGPALAHGLYIFAWSEEDKLCTESYFSKSAKAGNAEVRMLDSAGNIVHTARTNERGLACFPAPGKAEDLSFVVLAGQGHRGEFKFPASEFAAPDAPGEAAAGKASASGDTAGSAAGERASAGPAPASPPALGAETIRLIIREELEREFAPLRRQLAGQNAAPGFRDILGGLGWIVGLAGLAAFFTRKKK